MPRITVTWRNNKPYADDCTVTGKAAQTITWVSDGTVNITGITKPSDGQHNDFTTPSEVGSSGNWSTTDSMANNGNYSYTISGTHISGGPPASHDPKITNDRGN